MKINLSTRVRSRINSGVMLLLLVTLAVLLAWLSIRYPVQFDWTKNGRHSLSRASQEILMRMPDKIEIKSYARETPPLRDAIKKFIDRYQQSKQNIVLHFVNPDVVPDEVRNLGITVNGELVVRYQGRTEHVQS
ncbi:MAG: Gldg family protein, partial [Gammaproteobacteria bacterium]